MPELNSRPARGLQSLLRDDTAATAIEYALIAGVTGLVVAAAMGPLQGSPIWGVFQIISDHLNELTNQ